MDRRGPRGPSVWPTAGPHLPGPQGRAGRRSGSPPWEPGSPGAPIPLLETQGGTTSGPLRPLSIAGGLVIRTCPGTQPVAQDSGGRSPCGLRRTGGGGCSRVPGLEASPPAPDRGRGRPGSPQIRLGRLKLTRVHVVAAGTSGPPLPDLQVPGGRGGLGKPAPLHVAGREIGDGTATSSRAVREGTGTSSPAGLLLTLGAPLHRTGPRRPRARS
jgi:hypothetical protein